MPENRPHYEIEKSDHTNKHILAAALRLRSSVPLINKTFGHYHKLQGIFTNWIKREYSKQEENKDFSHASWSEKSRQIRSHFL